MRCRVHNTRYVVVHCVEAPAGIDSVCSSPFRCVQLRTVYLVPCTLYRTAVDLDLTYRSAQLFTMARQLRQSSLQFRHHRSVEPHRSHVSAPGDSDGCGCDGPRRDGDTSCAFGGSESEG